MIEIIKKIASNKTNNIKNNFSAEDTNATKNPTQTSKNTEQLDLTTEGKYWKSRRTY